MTTSTARIVVTCAMTGLVVLAFYVGARSDGGLVPRVQAHDVENQENGGRSNCSIRTLKGPYGFSFIGTLVGIGPIAGIGVHDYDGAGHFSSVETTNANGSGGIPETATGTYTVGADCRGSSTTTFSNGQVLHLGLVVVNQGREILVVVTDPGVVTTGDEKKQ